MKKKGKAPAYEKSEMTPLFTDTICTREAGIPTWEGMYRLLEEENLIVKEVTVTTDGRGSSEASLMELACSFLHDIAARLKILPYTDMVKWIIDHAIIYNREFKTRNQEVIVTGKSSVHSKLLVPLRLVAILETNKLKLLLFSFMRSR